MTETTVVVSGRVPQGLMDQIKKFGKGNSEIINEALKLYVNQKSDVYTCKQPVYKEKRRDEYNLLCKTLDSLDRHYHQFFNVLDKMEGK